MSDTVPQPPVTQLGELEKIATAQQAIATATQMLLANSDVVVVYLGAIQGFLERVAVALETLAAPPPVVGITTVFTPREQLMRMISKPTTSALKAAPKAAASTQTLALADNSNGTATVYGIDEVGNPVDISSVATLTVSSDTPAVATVGTPTGMTFPYAAATNPAPAIGATANWTSTATWNPGTTAPAGSPFTDTVTVTIGPSAVGGIGVKFPPAS
jgi:hypothetical protein